MLPRFWIIPGWVPTEGGWSTTPPHHPSSNVCACHWDGGRKKQKGWSTKADSMAFQGWTLRQMFPPSSLGVSNFPEGDLGPLPWGIHAQKAAQPTTMHAQIDGEGHQRNPVFPVEPPMKERRYCWAGGGPRGAGMATLWPSCPAGPHSQTWGRDHLHDEALWEPKEAHWQHWRLPAYWS